MFKNEKLYVCRDIAEREVLCKRLTDNGATIAATVGEPGSIHIFNSFEGELYEDCVRRGVRIIGLPCLQDSLQTGKPIPRTAYPVYSRVMEGIIVYGDSEEKVKFKSYVNQMNGTWADELNGETQYFIANEPGSIHYLWALEYGSHIVQPSWITESWDKRVLSNPKSHILPPLTGCVISVTGLSTETRSTIQHLVTHYGGKYAQQLSRKVTHLLCDKAAGRKYTTAISWGIHVVNSNWLYDSINAKGAVDATRYEVPPDTDGGGVGVGGIGEALYGLRSSSSSSSSSSYPNSYSSYSRPNPYDQPLGSSRSRLSNHVTTPILIRRHRTAAGANYAPLFSLPSHHQFAHTTQMPSAHSAGVLSHSALRHQSSLTQSSGNKTSSSSRSREKEGRTSMDRYRDMIDQVTGLLRMCDDIIEKSGTMVQNPNNNNNNNNSNNNNSNDNFNKNYANILNNSLSSNISSITNLYHNLNNLCNSNTINNNNNPNNNNNTNSNKNFQLLSTNNSKQYNTNNTVTTASTSINNNNNNNDNIETLTNKPVPTSNTTTNTNNQPPTTSTETRETNTEENTDLEMESDDDTTTTTTTLSEQEK